MRERIGIFGGAFNPVHNGHLAIAEAFLNSRLIHRLLILPTPDPPHKESRELAPFRHRFRMLQIAFEEADNVEISDLETRLDPPSYTVRTIRHLQETQPDTLWYLCIGSDSLEQFTGWYRYREILDRVSLIVAARGGYPLVVGRAAAAGGEGGVGGLEDAAVARSEGGAGALEGATRARGEEDAKGAGGTESVPHEILERTIFVDHEPLEISSTDIRKQFGSKAMGVSGQKQESTRQTALPAIPIPEKVRLYLEEHDLYR